MQAHLKIEFHILVAKACNLHWRHDRATRWSLLSICDCLQYEPGLVLVLFWADFTEIISVSNVTSQQDGPGPKEKPRRNSHFSHQVPWHFGWSGLGPWRKASRHLKIKKEQQKGKKSCSTICLYSCQGLVFHIQTIYLLMVNTFMSKDSCQELW